MDKIIKILCVSALFTTFVSAQTKQDLQTPQMVFVKGGEYDMGDIFNEGEEDEKPIHKVTIKSFYLGKYEVTQKEWILIMGENPSYYKNDNFPVEMVSWDEVQVFIKKLNDKTGKKYRLPTEAEWEYAAREGGKKVRYGNGKDTALISDLTFYDDETKKLDENKGNFSFSGKFVTEIGLYTPNQLGLYDMSGNVFEWCQDIYDVYLSKTQPKYPYHVIRGGSYGATAYNCRNTKRGKFAVKNNNLGFRLALDEK